MVDGLAGRSGDVRVSTRANYVSTVACHLRPRLGGIPLAELSSRDIEGMPARIVKGRGPGREVSPATLHRVLSCLRAALNAAVREGLPPIRLHVLRHGAAPLPLKAGAGLKVVSDQFGHSSIVITADSYTSVLPHTARHRESRTHRGPAAAPPNTKDARPEG